MRPNKCNMPKNLESNLRMHEKSITKLFFNQFYYYGKKNVKYSVPFSNLKFWYGHPYVW